MNHLSMPCFSPTGRRCPKGVPLLTRCPLRGKGRMLPPLVCVHTGSLKHLHSQRVQGPEPAAPCTWLAGTEELLGHLRWGRTPIRTVTAASRPAESDLTVQTEKMRRHRLAEFSPQTSSHQRWHRRGSPPYRRLEG